MATKSVILDKLELKAKLFRGFGDTNRLKLVELLKNGPLNVSQLVQGTKLTQPNVSAHLRCLRDCQLVSTNRKGKEIYYELTDLSIIDLFEKADQVLELIYQEIFACINY